LIENPADVIRYQYDNHLGSASLELDNTGNIISYEEYHPFGTTSYQKSNTSISQKRYKYVGKERDEETGLYYYGARYYAAWICRFVSVDPLQFDYPELTSFQYSSNRPISGIDLDGLEYVDASAVRVVVKRDGAHINFENCSSTMRTLWKQRDEKQGVFRNTSYPKNSIGWSTLAASFESPKIPEEYTYIKRGDLSLDNTVGATDPASNPGLHQTINKNGSLHWQYKNLKINGISPKAGKVAVGLTAVVNAITWFGEAYASTSLANDKKLINEHTDIFVNYVMLDIELAVSMGGIIPDEYLDNIDSIANVVLSGVNLTDDNKIYEIGMDIVNKISINNPKYPKKEDYSSNIGLFDNIMTTIKDGIKNTEKTLTKGL